MGNDTYIQDRVRPTHQAFLGEGSGGERPADSEADSEQVPGCCLLSESTLPTASPSSPVWSPSCVALRAPVGKNPTGAFLSGQLLRAACLKASGLTFPLSCAFFPGFQIKIF